MFCKVLKVYQNIYVEQYFLYSPQIAFVHFAEKFQLKKEKKKKKRKKGERK